MHECSEAVRVATCIKQSYQYFLAPINKKYNITEEMFEKYLEEFNGHVAKILEVSLRAQRSEVRAQYHSASYSSSNFQDSCQEWCRYPAGALISVRSGAGTPQVP